METETKSVFVSCYQMIQWLSSPRGQESISKMPGWTFQCYEHLKQTVPEDELVTLLPNCDYWILGDDPATQRVLDAGKKGLLKGVVKWGVGIDNLVTNACEELGLPWTNTPGLFADEVADMALGYTLALTRQLYTIDRSNREGFWFKPTTRSTSEEVVVVLGFGNVGQALVKRLLPLGPRIIVVDPAFDDEKLSKLHCPQHSKVAYQPHLRTALHDATVMIVTCELNASTRYLINRVNMEAWIKPGLYLINVARGAVVVDLDVVSLLESGHLAGYASDVFEEEPLPEGHHLLWAPNCILGSHNASNTHKAINRTCKVVLEKLQEFTE